MASVDPQGKTCGRHKFAAGLEVIDSLKAVSYAPDGTVDLASVDGLVRSLALAIEAVHRASALRHYVEGNLRDRIVRATTDQHVQLLGTDHPGILVASQGVGRMGVTNELLVKAQRLRGTPIIDAPTSWQYFVWKLQYDAERTAEDTHTDLPDLHIVRGLQS